MRKSLYPKLAAAGIRKNGRFYLPYLVICTAMIGMFYILCVLYFSDTLTRVGSSIFDILKVGCIFTAILSAVILFYTNSFIMKRRQKEIGLYNILGMEKKHIARIFFWETLMLFVGTLITGMIFGMVFEKLVMLVLFRILHEASESVQFVFNATAIFVTVLEFGVVFFLNLLFNMLRVARAKPVELLHSGVGEREPKTKLIMAILGLLCLGGGYAIAIVEKEPIKVLLLFFLAVVLVVVGTYLLFTAGSIALLKILRRNKKYYYKAKHFTSVSGMMYRMKQNAVGLASICILSTMVLVTVSTTVSLYIGIDDILDHRYAYDSDIMVSVYTIDQETGAEDAALAVAKSTIHDNDLKLNKITEITNFYLYGTITTDEFFPEGANNVTNSGEMQFIAADDYAALTGDTTGLSENQTIVYSKNFQADTLRVCGQEFTVVKHLSENPLVYSDEDYVSEYCLAVVPEKSMMAIQRVYNQEKIADAKENGGEVIADISTSFYLDLDGSDKEIRACYDEMADRLVQLKTEFSDNSATKYPPMLVTECQQESRVGFFEMYGGLLFLGLFLGTVFMLCAVLIIYFKQISEGYEDRKRFEIMRQVGMTRSEVKASIRSQVLTVFFLPILMAAVHMLAAFPMITRILKLMSLTNTGLFTVCVLATVAGYALIYTIVYLLTARVYYKIVSE